MKKNLIIIWILLLVVACGKTTKSEPPAEDSEEQTEEDSARVWNFDDWEGWEQANQADNAQIPQTTIEDGAFRLFTRAGHYDRTKVMFPEKFGAGRYEWKIYISDLEPGDQVSVAGFLYSDDHHELDFEVGPGRKEDREREQTKEDEVIAFMTGQDHPWFQSSANLKKNAWHTFAIDLSLKGDRYFAEWYIDGEKTSGKALDFGAEIKFRIFCSIENLSFMGEHLPHKENDALFDYVKFIPY